MPLLKYPSVTKSGEPTFCSCFSLWTESIILIPSAAFYSQGTDPTNPSIFPGLLKLRLGYEMGL